MQSLAAENESLRDTNKDILLRHTDDQCVIKKQEDLISQQKAVIDGLMSQCRSAAMPLCSDSDTNNHKVEKYAIISFSALLLVLIFVLPFQIGCGKK